MKTFSLATIASCAILASGFAARSAETGDDKKPSPTTTEATKPYKNVNATEFDTLRSGTNTVVLDVRTAKEFAAGHVPGAINIDVNSPEFAAKVARLDTNKTYLVNCAVGRRSVTACNKLATLHFGKLYNLQGGYDAWEEAGKPVEKQ